MGIRGSLGTTSGQLFLEQADLKLPNLLLLCVVLLFSFGLGIFVQFYISSDLYWELI